MSGGDLSAWYGEYFGNNGAGTFIQSGGMNSTNYVYLGNNSGSSGSYNLSGSAVLSAYIEYVGYSGAGTFTQSGGTNNIINGALYVGYGYGSLGAYNLSGSGVLSAPYEYLGYSGTGTFTQSGGTNNIGSGVLYLGSNSGAGTYALSGSGVLWAAEEYLGTDEYENSSGTGMFNQSAGLNAVNYLSIGSQGLYQFSGGTLQVVGGGLANQGVFDAMQGRGLLTVTGSAIVDFSQGSLVNTGSMSLAIGPDSLLLVPAGFNPATAFRSYSLDPTSLMHVVGTPLTILPGQGFSGWGSIADPVNCRGTIAAATGLGGPINLNGGITVSGTGDVDLGAGQFIVNDGTSGMSGGVARGELRIRGLLRQRHVYAVRRDEQRWQLWRPALPRLQRG